MQTGTTGKQTSDEPNGLRDTYKGSNAVESPDHMVAVGACVDDIFGGIDEEGHPKTARRHNKAEKAGQPRRCTDLITGAGLDGGAAVAARHGDLPKQRDTASEW